MTKPAWGTLLGNVVNGRALFWVGSRGEERFSVRWLTGFYLATALCFGVELGAEQDRDVRQPQPDEEDHDRAKRAIRLVV
jgi:hypothetical protein